MGVGLLDRAPLIAFIPVSDLAVARRFYEQTLGLRVTGENPYSVVLTAGGSILRLTQVDDLHPQPFTIAGWEVADIGVAVDALVARGITFTRYDGMGQDAKGVWTTPGGDFVAWFTDPDGNTLSLTSFTRRQA
jgi:catechol 2,3-dioxygenase-like lactoylglutathione lyase family enzyme